MSLPSTPSLNYIFEPPNLDVPPNSNNSDLDGDWVPPQDPALLSNPINIESTVPPSSSQNEAEEVLRPGEYIMRTLFTEFTILAEKKIDTVMSEPQDRPLSKSLQRGEDVQFDQLLSTFGCVAEHCLPSILRALYSWYERQMGSALLEQNKKDAAGRQQLQKGIIYNMVGTATLGSGNDTVERWSEVEIQKEKRDLAVEFIFCLVLIEVLKQLPFHPGHEDLIQYIENLAFKHFKYRDGVQNNPNGSNIHIISDLYAEVIGVLAQSRFLTVRTKFMNELKELRGREASPHTTQSIISLLMGMKFFRVKMVPIEEFEASFQYMQECAQYFLEVKDKDIKHALAGLFVEILVPVAATVKNEVNVPCLKHFVEMLYSPTLDASTKSKHRLALFPLVTCLLCVSQKQFFLQNWHYFLAMCLSHLKNRDTKMCRVALESLYRLLWVYMIRIKCESNSATQSRLQSIVNSLFPKGSKAVVPRDTPLNIFVKIIQFIAQERLDFAMREIVFDLLSVGRPIKIILTPERMSIGLRAFLVVADSLQQKEGEPPMPRSMGVLPSGNTLRRGRKTYLNKMLTEDTARSIGISAYFPHVRRVFVDILRALDVQYGRPLMMTNTQNVNKEPDEMITGERKPRIDLFRTCVAAIPRLIPDGMTKAELVDLLSRLTVHMDEELRALAFQSLQTLIIDFPDWRQDVLWSITQFFAKDVLDSFPNLIENGLKMILTLCCAWKNALLQNTNSNGISGKGTVVGGGSCSVQSQSTNLSSGTFTSSSPAQAQSNSAPPSVTLSTYGTCSTTSDYSSAKSSLDVSSSRRSGPTNSDDQRSSLHLAEALALVMLCHYHVTIRRTSVLILKELRSLIQADSSNNDSSKMSSSTSSVIDTIDTACPDIVEKLTSTLVGAEKMALLSAGPQIDLQWLADRATPTWTGEFSLANDDSSEHKPQMAPPMTMDPWSRCIYEFLKKDRVPTVCPMVLIHAWPIVFNRLNALYTHIDPNPLNDNRASLLRSSTTIKKPPSEKDIYLRLWKSYTIFVFRVVPQISNPITRCASPDLSLSSSPDSLSTDRTSNETKSIGSTNTTPMALYKLILPLLKCESIEVRETAVLAVSSINSEAAKDLIEELLVYCRESVDRKQENVRRRRRKDALRLHLVRTFELMATNETFANSLCVYDKDTQTLTTPLIEFIEGVKYHLENDTDKTSNFNHEITLYFGRFLRAMITNFSRDLCRCLLKRDVRRTLFMLFSYWSQGDTSEELKLVALRAMSTLLCCGPCCFDTNDPQDDSFLYQWLNQLLHSTTDDIYHLGQETVILLLESNPDIGAVLDWVVDKCYTGNNSVADGCFLALAAIFSSKEYPCDHYTAIINVTLMNTGCARAIVRDTALQLLQILDKRFFGTVVPPTTEGDDPGTSSSTLDVLLAASYCRTQLHLSTQLALLHPELTMPIFSEITCRFQVARPEVRQILLQYLLPWLHNIELVDPNVQSTSGATYTQYFKACKEGWGSVEATEMVLNNIFYITAKFGDSHAKEIEDVWATLCTSWPNNMKVIVRYLIIISGMAPIDLLPYSKRTILYLAHIQPDRLLDEIVLELQTIETLNSLIERTETPPFYRLTMTNRKISASNHSETTEATTTVISMRTTQPIILQDERGTIHTKRHSADDAAKLLLLQQDCTIGDGLMQTEFEHHQTRRQPHPLPMPEYGGYFAPLTEYLPECNQPILAFHRCSLGVMLLCDIVIEGIDYDWSIHVPLILHIIFLGLDNTRLLVFEHCKQLLLNLLIVLGKHFDYLSIAHILLNNRTSQLDLGLTTTNLTMVPLENDSIKGLVDFLSRQQTPLWSYEDITAKIWQIHSAEQLDEFLQYVLKVFENALPNGHIGQRWAQTALQLGLSCSSRHFAGRSLEIFRALRVPLSGRMLSDVLGRLVETVSEQGEDMQGYVTELLLTLEDGVETMDTPTLTTINYPLIIEKELFKSTPNLNNSKACRDGLISINPNQMFLEDLGHARSTSYSPNSYCNLSRNSSGTTTIKEGVTVTTPTSFVYRNTTTNSSTAPTNNNNNKCLPRSRSAQSLKQLSGGDGTNTNNTLAELSTDGTLTMNGGQDDKLTILSQLFWVAISLLESDYEHEFLLAIRLLQCIMRKMPLDRLEVREKIEKLQSQLRWSGFPGLHALLLKGCTHPNIYEPVVRLLAELTPLLNLSVIDPSQSSVAFPMNVIALLPYMLQNYEDANGVCIKSAENIARVCIEKSKKLENLATVMNLYSQRKFSKESFQWTKCVIKYLYDTYACFSMQMLTFLMEVLEKSTIPMQLPILNIIHCTLHYVDLTSTEIKPLINDLLHLIIKYIDGTYWQEALKILKLIVTQSSSLVLPPSTIGTNSVAANLYAAAASAATTNWESTFPIHHPSFVDESCSARKELPGRTMEFTFDLSQTPVIGRRFLNSATAAPKSIVGGDDTESSSTPQLISPAADLVVVPQPPTGWKRPWQCQSRVRECLVNVLTTCGQKVGLPKSPSVIFSQTSDVLERQSLSMASSTEEMSYCGNNTATTTNNNNNNTNNNNNSNINISNTNNTNNSITNNNNNNSNTNNSNSNANDNSVGGGTGTQASGGGAVGAASTAPNGATVTSVGSGGGGEFGVFKDFDFLEYESESIEGDSTDNFNWGVRRRPLSQDDLIIDSTEMTVPSSQIGPIIGGSGTSTPNRQKLIPDIVPKTVTLPTTATTITSTSNNADDESSEDEDIGSESPLDDLLVPPEFHRPTSVLLAKNNGNDHVIPILTPIIDTIPNRYSSSSTDSSTASSTTSSSSIGDLGDITPSNSSPNLSGLLAIRISSKNDQLFEKWGSFIQMNLLQMSYNEVEFYHRLQNLIRDMCLSTMEITSESCNYMMQSILVKDQQGIKTFTTKCTALNDIISGHMVPMNLIWFPGLPSSDENGGTTKLFDGLKYNLLEIQEHFETFCEKRQQVLMYCDAINATLKLEYLSGQQQSTSDHIQYILDLAKSLYKLHFQLLLLVDANYKILSVLQNVLETVQLNNATDRIQSVKTILSRIYEDNEADGGIVDDMSFESQPSTSNIDMYLPFSDIALCKLIDEDRYARAILFYKTNRDELIKDNPDLCQDDTSDIYNILNLYCRRFINRNLGCFVLVTNMTDLTEFFGRLFHVSHVISDLDGGLLRSKTTH